MAAVLEHGGKVRATVVKNRRKKALQSLVRDNVEVGSALYSDALKSYEGLADDFAHQAIGHAEAYVNGQVHTNGMENFWSLLKRRLHGTCILAWTRFTCSATLTNRLSVLTTAWR